MACLIVTGDNLQPEQGVTQTDNLVFPSINLRERVSMSRLWCCNRSIPMIGIETSATTKIQCMGLRKPTLR